MSFTRNLSPSEPTGKRRELARLIGRIQALRTELGELRLHAAGSQEVRAKERRLEQLRWRLAATARSAAADSSRAGA
jgi:hypothetical protein